MLNKEPAFLLPILLLRFLSVFSQDGDHSERIDMITTTKERKQTLFPDSVLLQKVHKIAVLQNFYLQQRTELKEKHYTGHSSSTLREAAYLYLPSK